LIFHFSQDRNKGSMMSRDFPLTLFYDAACPVCALEMDHLRSRDAQGRLVFVDIARPGFDAAAYGLRREALDAVIHALRPDGTVMRGMPVLRAAYAAVGLGWVLRATGCAPLRPLADAGYAVFARHRRSISRGAAPFIHALRTRRARTLAARMARCGEEGGCQVPSLPAVDAARDRTKETVS
jgi:predicted DCC family thiol-disulfide oxidoreductase YuxK